MCINGRIAKSYLDSEPDVKGINDKFATQSQVPTRKHWLTLSLSLEIVTIDWTSDLSIHGIQLLPEERIRTEVSGLVTFDEWQLYVHHDRRYRHGGHVLIDRCESISQQEASSRGGCQGRARGHRSQAKELGLGR